ncbi:MAG TPA: hypothetical protein HA362_01785 [Nanoarchaeota archaeon]|nr:hypothetical protein [Nanoarchaeota archaeon]
METNRFQSLVRQDYEYMRRAISLCISYRARELLLMQSVEGHAIQGDGAFKETVCVLKTRGGRKRKVYLKEQREPLKFPETTIDDVVNALGHDTAAIKEERQQPITAVIDFFHRLMAGEQLTSYTDRNGKPLFGMTFLEGMRLENPAHTIIGGYFGGRMDKYIGWRQESEKVYGVQTGGGECIGINRRKAKEAGIALEQLATKEHTQEEVAALIAKGILCWDVESGPDIVSGYVRCKQGFGTSDDLAVLLAGRLFSYDAAIGLFLADAIDTWDKYVPFIHKSGQDEKLGEEICGQAASISKNVPQFRLPAKEEVLKFIALIAESNYDVMTSSSQRYFLQVPRYSKQCAIESYINYIRTWERGSEMHVGHPLSGLSNHGMFDRFEAKCEQLYN